MRDNDPDKAANKNSLRTPDASASYADAGVDIDAGNALVKRIAPLAKATARAGAVSDLGGFGGLFDLKACGYNDPVLVAANDGVGTKLKIAIDAGQHKSIGIDLVAMSVNDLIVQGAEPLFFLDYFACGRLEPDIASDVIGGVTAGCQQAGCALIGGETAEMPGIYAASDYDLAGFAVGAVERDAILPRRDMQTGDILLGLESSGVHANGFSLVRQLVKESGLSWDASPPFASPHANLASALLIPTHIYVKPVLAVLRETSGLKALCHITGGGFSENMPRILPDGLACDIDLTSWPLPPVFAWLQQQGAIETDEMLRVFNCGIGMVLVVAPDAVVGITTILQAQGINKIFQIGTLTKAADSGVRFNGAFSDD